MTYIQPWKMLGLRLLLASLFGCAITAPALSAGRNEAQHLIFGRDRSVTSYTLTQLNKAIADYRLTHHALPRSLSQLRTGVGDGDYSRLPDGWGYPISYTVRGTHYLVTSYGQAAQAGMSLRAGAAQLTLSPVSPGRYGVRLTSPGVFVQDAPLAVEVVDARGAAAWLTGAYDSVRRSGGELVCVGTVRTLAGTQFRFTDRYAPLPGIAAFTLTRDVQVITPAPEDRGFSTRFSLSPARVTAITDDEFFVPGVWYKDNAHVPPGALAGRLTDRFFYCREDRLPLPLVMQRDKRSGVTLTLTHLGGDPTTFAGEDGLDRLTDARLQFGSVGITNTDGPAPTFLFPGTEGARTYTYGSSPVGDCWAYRSHPVRAGVPHSYRLLIQAARAPDFPVAQRRAWRTAYTLQDPPVIRADLAKVYRDGVGLLDQVTHFYQGVISVPFAASVPDGKVVDTSSQMGFVGQALPAATLLLQGSLEAGDAQGAARASAVVDFWARNSPTASGLPRTWYDIHPDGSYTWRDYHTFLRVASDGADGALQAWNVQSRRGQNRPDWLLFCRRYGDWLVGAQNADGSWFREYGFDGRVAARPTDARSRDTRAPDTTDHPIPFLVDLYEATGDVRYRESALRAGEFCLRSVHDRYAYIGGTPDNPNVLDKEGGMMALDAFLALYDIAQDSRWLAAAVRAADYSETWVYCWNIPMPPHDPKIVFPRGRRTEGLSLIATGHSGSDSDMAAAPFFFYRLSLLTGDAHFRDMARLLLHDTKQLLDWDGALGYAAPGLQTEALSLPPLRGHGTTHWLPWLTVAQCAPLVRLRDVFGSFDIDEIERLPAAERLRRQAAFSKRRGFDARVGGGSQGGEGETKSRAALAVGADRG